MTAPESKWVAEAMDLVTLVVVAKQRDGVLRQTKLFPEARDKLESHLQRQADLMERMGEALAEALDDSQEVIDQRVASLGEYYRPKRLAGMREQLAKGRAALTAFQESKQ